MSGFSKGFEAGAQSIGQKIAKTIPTTGPARVESDTVESVDRVVPNRKMETLRFMEEPVKIIVHKTADKMADPVVQVWNGGVSQMMIRGQPIVVKRKFVEVLARARDIRYEQETYIDKSTGEAVNRMVPVVGLKYPFDVLEDSNPSGRAWLQNVLKEEN